MIICLHNITSSYYAIHEVHVNEWVTVPVKVLNHVWSVWNSYGNVIRKEADEQAPLSVQVG